MTITITVSTAVAPNTPDILETLAHYRPGPPTVEQPVDGGVRPPPYSVAFMVETLLSDKRRNTFLINGYENLFELIRGSVEAEVKGPD